MKILHLIIDHQVIERTLGVYEKVFPGCNDVLVFSEKKSPVHLKHLNKYASCMIVTKENVIQTGKAFDFEGYDHVVIHYLIWQMIEFVKLVPTNVKVCWEIYGYDLYNQFLEPLGYKIQQVDSKKYLSPKSRLLKSLKLDGLYLYLRSGNGMRFNPIRNKLFKQITSRVDSIAVCCTGDAKVLTEYTGREYQVFKAFNYSLHETLGELYGAPFNDAKGIMIGNSASFSNNHLYVLEMMKKFQIGDANIIMPLSYGGVPQYKDEVMDAYKKEYPGQVNFLLEYMPLHEYNRTFLKIGTMILASWRQESIGTIMMGFYLGIKVFMSNKSPLYQSLEEEGFVVYVIEDATNTNFSVPLTVEQKEHNRNLLLKDYSEEAFEKELNRQFSN